MGTPLRQILAGTFRTANPADAPQMTPELVLRLDMIASEIPELGRTDEAVRALRGALGFAQSASKRNSSTSRKARKDSYLQSDAVRQLLPSHIQPSPTVFAESAQARICRHCPDPVAGISDD